MSRLNKDQILSRVALKAHVKSKLTAKSQIFNAQRPEGERGAGRGSSEGQAAPGPLHKGARTRTLSAQLNKLCEIIKHDHLLLLSITSKSKLSEEQAPSTGAPSAPIG